MTTDAATAAVLVADAERLFASAVATALGQEPGLRSAGHATSAAELIGAARKERLDVALVDAGLPGGGIETARKLLADHPTLRVLVTAPTQDHAVLLQALEVGASGLVPKDGRLADVVAAVRAVLRGEACVPRRMLGGLLHELIQRKRHDGGALERYARLSRREREVLALLARGQDQEDIARLLVISPQTARTHIQNVMNKLEVHSRVEAAAFAIDHGFHGDFPADGLPDDEPHGSRR